MQKITRISYNSQDWKRPTGEARNNESVGTYNQEHGFGHEDWLFRSEWMVDGWRYAFIQGVNKGHAKLVRSGHPVDLILFTILPDKRRCFIASIDEVECLDDKQAQDALDIFKQRGWYEIMRQEIGEVGGNDSALGDAAWAKHILNVRFRQENVLRFAPGTYASPDDPIMRLWRYQLYNVPSIITKNPVSHDNEISSILPSTKTYTRRGTAPVECTPEHARIQQKLIAELKIEFPKARILCEQDFIDVSVRTDRELILFEIKSDLDPRSVLRQALGQILEYAYHPSRVHTVTVRLVIVGRRPLSSLDETYLSRLKTDFLLPLDYRFVDI